MINIINKEKCSGCKACYNICPKNCIGMETDYEGFWYPVVEEKRCIKCGLCIKVCPEINIYQNKEAYKNPVALAAWNLNDKKRFESSSGGIFTSLSEWILSEDGIVFGAGYNKNFEVIHKSIDSISELDELRGSKYVQSDIRDSYKTVKKYLEKDVKVLFTGTPCQVTGLKKYLNNDYKNLYTCDLVCHGVPSPKVFEKYKKMLEKNYNSNINKISFRHKKYGWKLFSILLEFSNKTKYSKTLKEDPYMIGFLKDYYLRPSCYECIHSKIPRASDITLADYWGVSNKYPELDDDKGTSLLLINSKKGKDIMDNCKKEIFTSECDLEHAILGNPCIIKSVKKPKLRKQFFEDFNNKDFNYVVKKYMSEPPWIKRKYISIRRKIGLARRKVRKIF